MRTRSFNSHQRGAASAIAVFLMLVLVAGMVLATLFMSSSSISSSSQQADSVEALFLAESALERVVAELNTTATLCGSLNSDLVIGATQSYGTGTFKIESDSGGTTDCLVKVSGQKGNIIRYIQANIHNSGGTGGGGGGGSFIEHFPGPGFGGWTWVPNNNNGSFALDTTCLTATCNGYDGSNTASGSSVQITANTGGGWNTMDGYAWKLLDTPIDTSGGNVTLDFSVGWKKNIIGSTGGVQQRMSIELEQSPGTLEEIWRDWTNSNANVWIQDPTPMASVTLTAGRVYDRIRINLYVRGRSGRVPYMWVDEIVMSQGGGGTSPDWAVSTWSEVDI